MARTSDMLRNKFLVCLAFIALWAPFSYWVHRQLSFIDPAVVQALD